MSVRIFRENDLLKIPEHLFTFLSQPYANFSTGIVLQILYRKQICEPKVGRDPVF